MSKCERCNSRGQTWAGDAPQCGFPKGVFHVDNWNCATLNALRDYAGDDCLYSEDQHAALMSWDGQFIVIAWYKSRGRTELALLINESQYAPLQLSDAEAYLSERGLSEKAEAGSTS